MVLINSAKLIVVGVLAMLFSMSAQPAAAESGAQASEWEAGGFVFAAPWIRATPPTAKVAAGYVMVTNQGAQDDRLIGVRADFAATSELHEMTMDGGVMKMRALEDGAPAPLGDDALILEPGGLHLMFMGLSEPMTDGETRKVTLIFEKAGAVEVPFAVRRSAAGR